MKLEPGWLERQLKKVSEDVELWPEWMKREAGFAAPQVAARPCSHGVPPDAPCVVCVPTGSNMSSQVAATAPEPRSYSNPWTIQIQNRRGAWSEFCHDAPVSLTEAERREEELKAENPEARFRVVPWLNIDQQNFVRGESMPHVAEHPDTAARAICAEISEIMGTYHEQEKSKYGVDTPGGLQHMGDVWGLFAKWEKAIDAARAPDKPAEPAREWRVAWDRALDWKNWTDGAACWDNREAAEKEAKFSPNRSRDAHNIRIQSRTPATASQPAREWVDEA